MTRNNQTNSWLSAAAVFLIALFAGTAQAATTDLYSGDPLGRITLGPDGNLWFTSPGEVRKIRPDGIVVGYPIPAGSPTDITVGNDGNMWFGTDQDEIGRISTSGTGTTLYPVSGTPRRLTRGADGNVWFTLPASDRIGRITTGGTVQVCTLGHAASGITAGPDGNVWVSSGQVLSPTRISKVVPGAIIPGGSCGATIFSQPPTNTGAYDIVSGPDGNLWFPGFQNVGRITTGGVFLPLIGLGSGSGLATTLTVGPDQNLWVVDDPDFGVIRRVTPSGAASGSLAVAGDEIGGIATGVDQNIWFTVPGSGEIGRLRLYDTVISQPRGVSIKLGRGASSASKRVSLKVRNTASKSTPPNTVTLQVDDGDCPPGTVGDPDFDSVMLGAQTSTTLLPGASKSARLVVSASAADFFTANKLAPARCTATFTLVNQDPEPELERSISNNSIPLVIDVFDQNDF